MSNPHKRQRNKWLALISMPFQMGAVIYFFAKAGNWLDENYPNKQNVYIKTLTLFGVVLAFYNLNRQLKEINSMDDNKNEH
ncbi:AtpZ/AtpI family protein [Flavobacterium aciduliphilum]|uniref:Putative F0F1-ATPase subunit (Ca2+/Mg2+ transporter) n=1 Tax=Flavobacterium aciduliphilum TaxID=1101402 RepID=A0A328YDN1_9FLAO|nr:AtpZ/AtpI family protein [Flavobacterium aciduliphilum]RAR71334.1 putative F0F1-ATPase subunit (Ca2+/Mg2+ transporter) [Flavobacterium aciduliphilum]